MKFLAGLIEIASTKIGKYPSDTSGNSIIATLTGKAAKGETAQQYGQAGFISNPAAGTKGIRLRIGNLDIVIAALNYKVALPENPGETKVYSTDSDGAEKATHYLNKDSEHVFNSGTDFAVAHTDLNTDLQTFVTDLNAKLVTAFTAVGGSWPGTSIDISSAKVDKVKIP